MEYLLEDKERSDGIKIYGPLSLKFHRIRLVREDSRAKAKRKQPLTAGSIKNI